jgi:antitoxin HicB
VLYKLPLVLTPQSEGGFTVTSPLLPELLTEGDTAEEALANVADALSATIELYQDMGRALPATLAQNVAAGPVWLETLVPAP